MKLNLSRITDTVAVGRFCVTAVAFAIMIIGSGGRAGAVSDADLLHTVTDATKRRLVAVLGGGEGAKVMQESLAHLSDAEKTRALALSVYELDKNRQFGMRYNTPFLIVDLLEEDPSLITDPTELKAMIASETDARKFYILSSMARTLMDSIKGVDFIPEIAPMLYRNEPLAKMGGEYVFERLEHASYFAYDVIGGNLRALGADFVAPDVNLPYPDRIPVLVRWLRENWKGCEGLGLANTGARSDAMVNDPAPIAPVPSTSDHGTEVARGKSAPWIFGAMITGAVIPCAVIVRMCMKFVKPRG